MQRPGVGEQPGRGARWEGPRGRGSDPGRRPGTVTVFPEEVQQQLCLTEKITHS